jgi:hypothetical protein
MSFKTFVRSESVSKQLVVWDLLGVLRRISCALPPKVIKTIVANFIYDKTPVGINECIPLVTLTFIYQPTYFAKYVHHCDI